MQTVQWLDGAIFIANETHHENGQMIFGYRINGGEFVETSRLSGPFITLQVSPPTLWQRIKRLTRPC